MLKEKLNKINIILASGSPRRQPFFKEMDLHYTIRLKEIEEIYPEHLQAEEITNFLAELKASAFENELKENDVLVTSDTIVWLNGKALGKPKDYDDAFQMLQQLSVIPIKMHSSTLLSKLTFPICNSFFSCDRALNIIHRFDLGLWKFRHIKQFNPYMLLCHQFFCQLNQLLGEWLFFLWQMFYKTLTS